MSITVNLFAKKGNKTETFNCYQTPTSVTKRIYESGNMEKGYRAWVMEQEWLKHKRINHLTKLDAWLSDHKEWNINWELF